jgi:hypothetical protein
MKRRLLMFQAAIVSFLISLSAYATQYVSVTHVDSPVYEQSGTTYASFYIFRHYWPYNDTLRVYVSWSGTAASSDFSTALPSYVDIPAGVGDAFVDLQVFNDTASEGTEELVCSLTSAVNLNNPGESVVLWVPTAALDIYDNDAPTVYVTKVNDAEEVPLTVGKFRITRESATTSSLVVNYGFSGVAGASVDYNVGVGTLTSVTIPAGSTYVDVEIWPINDGLTETPERLHLNLASNSAYTLWAQTSATLWIHD